MTVRYTVGEVPDLAAYQMLCAAAWHGPGPASLKRLDHSLTWICAYDSARLVGFVNVAWDGGIHAFLLDPTVHPDWQRRGLGRELVRRAAEEARERGMHWLHVDFEPHLTSFYRACGFRATEAGLMRLA
ncbi:GNAT family N-acetyltransferase [Deinococcus rubellus]|uniref:GNAT family N-acetyltransferase n=1 Tax=Deinococcus rubellus TaxID=1889240 RepID=A0ABY5YLA3_9DEIO|nr:GNAT family N-acetyltransferase [Deinococcus rubellus]UWX65476.1 GNAT family N-acetyltransferase [Deinococcus rubellus]